LDYSIGFNGQFQLNSWTPLSVTIDNRGAAKRGNLEVIVTSGSEYQGDVYRTIYATEVDLPRNSEKRYTFTIILKSFTHELIIRLRQDGDSIFSKSVNLRSHFTEKNFAVVADAFVAPDILSMLPNHLYPANVHPKFLPDTWYGYDSVKLLILGTDTIRQLRHRQFRALIQWLNQGGYLVTGTGLNYGSLNDKRLQNILPIRVDGHRQLFELKSLGQFCNRELADTKPFLVLNARINDADILLAEDDIPIITQKRLGIGKIVFLSFDYNIPPFSRWDGRRMFWNKIFSLQPKIDRPAIEVEDQQIMDSMLAGMPFSFPNFKSVVIFVCVYLIFLWFFLRMIQKPGKDRWLYGFGLISLIILFTSIGYWGFVSTNLKQKFGFNSFCRIDLADSGAPATARYIIGLYSLKKSAYRFHFGSHIYPVTPMISAKSNTKVPDPYVLQNSDSGQYINGSVHPWSHSFYKMKLQVTSPLTGHVRLDKSFMTLMVENKVPHNLVDCLVYFRKRFLFVEDILANNRQTIKIDLAKFKRKEIFGEHEVEKIARHFDDNDSNAYFRKIQRYLTSDLLREIHNKYKSRSDSLILIGWMQAALIQPEFDQNSLPGTGITMINWDLPVEIAL
jgi:hypothetical protein